MEANFKLEVSSPGIIKESLGVEEDSSSFLTIDTGDGEINLKIRARNLSNMRARVNTILRLVKTAEKATRR